MSSTSVSTKIADAAKPQGKKKKQPLTYEERVERYEAKVAQRKKFAEMAEAQRVKVKKMSKAQRSAFFKARTDSMRAKAKHLQGDLIFPVKKVKYGLRSHYGYKKTPGAKGRKGDGFILRTESAIFTAAVLEYLVAEVLELSGECAKQLKKRRIVPRHMLAAIRTDEELNILFDRNVTFSKAGVLPKAIPRFLQHSKVNRKEWTSAAQTFQSMHIVSAKAANDSTMQLHEQNNNKY